MAGMYSLETIALAASRGYDDVAHQTALRGRDQDAMALTHPGNWLEDDEVEALTPSADELGAVWVKALKSADLRDKGRFLGPHPWETDDPRGAPPLGHSLPCKLCGLARYARIHQAKS
jgi:hypothetical protein